jgi:hypothetical protein
MFVNQPNHQHAKDNQPHPLTTCAAIAKIATGTIGSGLVGGRQQR